MKKALPTLFLLSLALLLVTSCATTTTKTPFLGNREALVEELQLPKEGEVISGFQVTGLYDYPEKNGLLLTLVHERTGAEVIFIANRDEYKDAYFSYRTRANNDKGIPHVFEHVCLVGSGKYPSASLFHMLSRQTYNTHFNASTANSATFYDLGSLDQKQLEGLMEFVLEGLADPMALQNEFPLGREAYRYTLYDKNDEISVTGNVFNEMESNNATPLRIHYKTVREELYPNSFAAANTGGQREEIVTVTLDELKEFHETYYHPSNMLILLYGHLNLQEMLDSLEDNYLYRFEKRENDLPEDSLYTPWEGYKELITYFPATAGSTVEDKGWTSYGIALDECSFAELGDLNFLEKILLSKGSPLLERLEKEFPGTKISSFFGGDYHPSFFFYLQGTNGGEEKRLKAIITEELEKIAREGFDEEFLEGKLKAEEMEILMNANKPESTSHVMDYLIIWGISGGSTDSLLEYREAKHHLRERVESGMLQRLIEKCFLEPKTSVAITQLPQPGLYEEQEAAFEKSLKEKKENMSEEELDALIQKTLAFDEWSAKDASDDSLLPLFQRTALKDLEIQRQETAIEKKTIGDVSFYSHDMKDCGYLQVGIYLSADAVPVEKLCDMRLLAALVDQLGTTTHTREEILKLEAKFLNDNTCSLFTMWPKKEKPIKTYLSYRFLAMEKDTEEAWSLLREILTSTDFSDVVTLRNIINKSIQKHKGASTDNINTTARQYALAKQDPNFKWETAVGNLKYIPYLEALSMLDDEGLRKKGEELQELLSFLLNSKDTFISAIGDQKAIAKSLEMAALLLEDFTTIDRETVDYAREIPDFGKGSFAILTNDSGNYNGYLISLKNLGRTLEGSDYLKYTSFFNGVLYPIFRYEVGAYGLQGGFKSNYLYVQSYRDPLVAESFEQFEKAKEDIRTMEISEEELENNALFIYLAMSCPQEELSLTSQNIIRMVLEEESATDEYVRLQKGVKETTVEEVKRFTEDYDKLIEEGIQFSVGNAGKLRDSGLFDEYIDIYLK